MATIRSFRPTSDKREKQWGEKVLPLPLQKKIPTTLLYKAETIVNLNHFLH